MSDTSQSFCTNGCGRIISGVVNIRTKVLYNTCCGACKQMTGPHTKQCGERNYQLIAPHLTRIATMPLQINIQPFPHRQPLSNLTQVRPKCSLNGNDCMFADVGSDHLPIIYIHDDIAIVSFNVLRHYSRHDSNMDEQGLPFLKTQFMSTEDRAYNNLITMYDIAQNLTRNPYINLVVLCMQESTPGAYPINAFSTSYYADTEQPIIVLKNVKYMCDPVGSVCLGKSKNANALTISNGTSHILTLMNVHMMSKLDPCYGTAKTKLLNFINQNAPMFVIGDLNTCDLTGQNTGLFSDPNFQKKIYDKSFVVFKNLNNNFTHRNTHKKEIFFDKIILIT